MKINSLMLPCIAVAIVLPFLPAFAADESVSGNLTVSGWGKFVGGVDVGATSQHTLDWDTSNFRVLSDINTIQGSFIWRDTYTFNNNIETARTKMLLGSSNLLTLYKSDGTTTTIGLTLDPNAGRITLPSGVAGAGIYMGGTSVLKASSSGGAIFSSTALFENGADFGTGNTLNASNVQFLRSTLSNLGYRDNPSNATPINSIKTTGNITISKIVGSGSFRYLLGNFDGQALIGNQSLNDWEPDSAGFLAKCDASGAVLWVKKFKSPAGYCSLSNVAINSSGNLAVVGEFSGTTNSFGTGKELSTTGTDGFVAVYNSSGVVQWTKKIGGDAPDSMQSVAIAANGAVTAVGNFSATTTTLAPYVLTSAGSQDGVVVRFSSSGTISWAKAIGSTGYDSCSTVTEDSAGHVIASGYFNGTLITPGAANRPGAGGNDGFLVKLNGFDGQALWSKAVGGASHDYITGHVLDSTGNIIAYGQFNQTTTTLEPGKNRSSVGSADGLVIKTDTSGVTQWTQSIGGLGNDQLSGAVLAADGKIVIAGTFSGSTTTLGTGLNVSSAGSQDILLVEIDPLAGSFIKARALGGTSYESIGSLSISEASGLCIVGSTAESFALGNTRMLPNSFNASWQGFDVVTPASSAATSFSWSGGLASGTGGIAMGNRAYASGSNSSALGDSSATGDSSFAAGKGLALGAGSVVIGVGSRAEGQSSLALGESNVTLGSYSGSLGTGNRLYGRGSFAIGQSNYISRDIGFVLGAYNSLKGSSYGGVSIGAYNGNHGDSGEHSVTLGADSTAIGNYSTAIGMAAVSYSYMNTALGSGNLGGGNATSWIETDPLLELGNQEWGGWNDPEGRSNAITTLKNGKTTLTNKAWKADNSVAPSVSNSNNEALVVEGHSRFLGRITCPPGGDIPMFGQ